MNTSNEAKNNGLIFEKREIVGIVWANEYSEDWQQSILRLTNELKVDQGYALFYTKFTGMNKLQREFACDYVKVLCMLGRFDLAFMGLKVIDGGRFNKNLGDLYKYVINASFTHKVSNRNIYSNPMRFVPDEVSFEDFKNPEYWMVNWIHKYYPPFVDGIRRKRTNRDVAYLGYYDDERDMIHLVDLSTLLFLDRNSFFNDILKYIKTKSVPADEFFKRHEENDKKKSGSGSIILYEFNYTEKWFYTCLE